MRILGIDPGIGRLGWGIIDEGAIDPKAIAFGCVETKSTELIHNRLNEIHIFVKKIINHYKPNILLF